MPVPTPRHSKISKVDEKIKAAEARRADLHRQKELEAQQRAEQRKGRNQTTSTPMKRKPIPNGNVSMASKNAAMPSSTQISAPSSSPTCSCQQAAPKPLLFTPTGEFIPGRYLKCEGSPHLLPIRQHRPQLAFKRLQVKLFTIARIEELLQKGTDLDLISVMLDILKKSNSCRHPIQNKFLQLQMRLMALERSRAQLRSRKRTGSDSISPLDSPKLSYDLRSPGSSMDALYRDYDGLLSNAQIDEITTRHNLSPTKTPLSKPSLIPIPRSVPLHKNKAQDSTSINNFRTVLSPRKHQVKDVDAVTVLTPLRKSVRSATGNADADYKEEGVAKLLLEDDSIAFIANPYIKSAQGTPSGKRRTSPEKKPRLERE